MNNKKHKQKQRQRWAVFITALSSFFLATCLPARAVDIYVSTYDESMQGKTGEGKIYKIDSESGTRTVIASGLDFPEDIGIDTKGIMYIGGLFSGVKRIDITTGARLTDVGTNVCGPEGPSIDAAGNVYVNTRLGPCKHSGVWRITGGTATTAVQLVPPFSDWGEGTAFLTQGTYAGCIIAADRIPTTFPYFRRIVRSCPPDFGPAVDFITPGGPYDIFGIAVNSTGDIFVSRIVSQPNGGEILRYDPNGVFKEVFVRELSNPAFMEFDEADNLYIVEAGVGLSGGRVRKVTPARVISTLATGLTAPIGIAIPPRPQRLSGVHVIDTVSTANIVLDTNSFSKSPSSITEDPINNRIIIEWQFPTFSIGQIEDLTFDVIVKNPVPGEDRLVNHKLEVLYTDVTGNPVRTELGPQFVHVLASAFSTNVSMDKAQYTANENVLIDLSITNLSEFSRTVDAVLEIEDSLGNLVQSVTTLSGLTFAVGETKTFLGLIYNTGKTFAGDYRAHARLIEAGKQVGEATANFTVLPVKQATSSIVSDRIAYSANEQVTLTSTLTSQSLNSSLVGLEATVSVIDPNGNPIFAETRILADLQPEARVEFKTYTNTGTYPAGLYTATLQVRSSGTSLTSAQANFEILSSAEQAAALAGSIEVNPTSIFEREGTTLTYTIQNIGNDIDLPLIQAEILVVDPVTELAVRTMTAETSLNGREVFTNSIQFDSTGLAPKPYLLVLRGTTAGVTQALDSAGLVINPVPNNAPTANAGQDRQGFVGQSVLLDGSASTDPDGDTLTFDWHFTSVPATSQITDAYLANATTPTPSFVPDAEGIYVLSLVVNDGLVNSPVDTVSVFVNPPPQVDVHPETINIKSNGGSRSITGVLTSPVLSSFEFFTAEDGTTVTASFVLENQYVASNGEIVIFTIPAEDYPGDDTVVPVDADGDGDIDLYQLTLKFNRDLLIAGFKDANGRLRITQPTELTSTVIGNSLRVGSDTNTVIAPP